MQNKKVLLIITGGIAAYKSLDTIRELKKNNVDVTCILTKSGSEFVTPLSIESLSGNKVYTDLFNLTDEHEMGHIQLSRLSDVILVAPATANMISKMAYGVADDLASTVLMATNKPILVAPAMNVRMWEHPSTKENILKLKSFGYKIIGPEIGDMACGEYGEGKMTEPNEIVNTLKNYFSNLDKNKKLKALVTAGPTNEYIDPVRFITNKSSGKQGYEIAKCLRDNGFDTTLISGKTSIKPLDGVNFVSVETAEEMFKESLNNLPTDVAIFSAAVSDFKVKNYKSTKIKKNEEFNLELEKNIDILNHISNHNSLRPKITIGFAAETNNLSTNAKEKLNEKNCDWIIANDVSDQTIGFGSDFNKISIFYKDKPEENFEKMSKSLVAEEIVKRIIQQIN